MEHPEYWFAIRTKCKLFRNLHAKYLPTWFPGICFLTDLETESHWDNHTHNCRLLIMQPHTCISGHYSTRGRPSADPVGAKARRTFAIRQSAAANRAPYPDEIDSGKTRAHLYFGTRPRCPDSTKITTTRLLFPHSSVPSRPPLIC